MSGLLFSKRDSNVGKMGKSMSTSNSEVVLVPTKESLARVAEKNYQR
jgi:hypothetical protein